MQRLTAFYAIDSPSLIYRSEDPAITPAECSSFCAIWSAISVCREMTSHLGYRSFPIRIAGCCITLLRRSRALWILVHGLDALRVAPLSKNSSQVLAASICLAGRAAQSVSGHATCVLQPTILGRLACGGLRSGQQELANRIEDQPGDPGSGSEYSDDGKLLLFQWTSPSRNYNAEER
jgi:hypothetical protein